ncbi:MAG: BrnA antitoxin family protein [Pigmentiphaga sp.]|nr:BrnA antitoxin family protein [Pigmentiphaga sp.]
MKKHNKTDWDHVRAWADKPVPYSPEDDLYDPNDEAAVANFWKQAKISRPGRPPVAVKRPTLNMRVDADVLEYLRASGKGWQTRVNALLREAVENGKI